MTAKEAKALTEQSIERLHKQDLEAMLCTITQSALNGYTSVELTDRPSLRRVTDDLVKLGYVVSTPSIPSKGAATPIVTISWDVQ